MAQQPQQWTPYGWMPFNQDQQQQQSMFLMPTQHSMMSPVMFMSPRNVMSPDGLQRPHSVAYGAPPAIYPFVNFDWQRQHQQQPDVTSQHHHASTGLLFRPVPDLVANSTETEQPSYANNQPTYANENDVQEQPCYMNTAEQRGTRGVSMPPVIQPQDWTPKPPPRSKRPSRMGSRSSLAGSVNSIDVNELTSKLNQLASVNSTPVRPPRRKRADKQKLKHSATLPRDFGLQSIAEDCCEQKKPLIPQPSGSTLSAENTKMPSVPMPTGAKNEELPVVPMPFAEVEKPIIPQPEGLIEKNYFSVTLPMPAKRPNNAGQTRSRAASLHSIRDEIIEGLQKMSENVNVLKQGVSKIYEDFKPAAPLATPTYAQPRRSKDFQLLPQKEDEETKETSKENPYETVNYRQGLVTAAPPPTTVMAVPVNDHDPDRAFRATFFGIDSGYAVAKSSNEDQLEEDNDDGDVTPTAEEEPEVIKDSEMKVEATVKIDEDDEESSTEEVLSDTETIDVSFDGGESVASAGKPGKKDDGEDEDDDVRDEYNELMYKAVGASWEEIEVESGGLPPPLALHANLHSLKLDLLSSIFQNLYPTEEDCVLVRKFLSCPASLEEKYSMIRLADLLRKNKRAGIELEDIAEAMSQLAKIGSELLRAEDDRDPLWRSIPVAKEIMVTKGIATRAPWENIQGGSEILESLGYTEYTGFALQYPRSVAPEFFADHIGNLTVELVLASVEISTLLIRLPPTLETLSILREAEAFPGNEAEVYYPEVPMLTKVEEAKYEEESPSKPNNENINSLMMTATVACLQSRDVRASSLPAFGVSKKPEVQQPGTTNVTQQQQHQPSTANRRHANESDYEEIGPPPTTSKNNNAVATSGGGDLVCDLCGTTAAIVRCAACADQIFCLSCDDMYHRHPRRTSHARKALAQQIRPPLPPKGSENVVPTPVAPPRKNLLRKGSAPDSPVTPTRNTANELPLPSRSSTLPRKMGSMVGRPLPPPPAATTNNNPPPLPPVSSSSMASATAPPLPAKTPSASQPAFYPMNDHNMHHRKLSTTSQPPMHLQFGHPHPEIPIPGYPMGVHPAFMDRYPGPPNVSQSWKSNPYLEEMEFPTRASNMAMNGFNNESRNNSKRMPPAQRSRFYKLNKSSSLHDIAHEEMNTRLRGNHELNNGISWMDEPWNTTQSTMNQPTMNVQELLDQQRNFRRASSTKSLHQGSDIWNGAAAAAGGSNMWQAQPPPNTNPMMQPQMMNPMLFAAMAGNQMPPPPTNTALSHQIPSSLHRSMHELHINRAPSPTMSQKSKKSTRSDRFLNRANKSRRNNQSSAVSDSKPSSRPHSRNKTRRDKKYRDSSRTRHSNRRRSISTEDDLDSEEAMANDLDEVDMDDEEDEDDEDFFTGESDNDFLSISSGSNSKRAPRKAWTCEHCTYVNNPGVGICAMCCRTTTSGKHRNEDYSNERSSSRASTRKKKSHRSKYESSEEDESEIKHKRNSAAAESKTNSLRRRNAGGNHKDTKVGGQRKKHAKSPMPEMQVSDPDDDAINEYYAVRHMDTSRNRMDSEGRCESSSETSSMHNNPLRKPNLDAPAPAKGILKKSNSNLELTKIGKNIGPPGRVVDIKKYLAQGPPPNSDLTNDIWQTEKNEWMRRQNAAAGGGVFNKQDNEYLSDDAASNSSTTNNVGRPSMTRSISGHSLGDLEYMQQQYDQQQQQMQSQRSSNRRTSDVGGKRNFRSKRFSRNLEREPALRRAQSLHMDRRGLEEDFVDHRGSLIRKSSANKQHSSGSSEDTMHFTATVHSSANQEMLGSHLARQEFGGNHEGIGDSGYMSHSSGMSRQQGPMESFTMSVDRGYLGRPPGDRDSQLHRSMDDLTFQKTKGLELVRLLREAEQSGFTAEDVQVALNHCGDANPVTWLKDNWDNMMDTVMTLASNVGHEAEENTIGTLSKPEAKDALRKHKGNIWAAVTECVEQRQLKYDQLCAKGNFAREDIVTVLTANQGNVDAAFQELNKVQLKPFLMRIWGQGDANEVSSGQDANLTDSPIKTEAASSVVAGGSSDDNVLQTEQEEAGNEVTETKHNNKNVGENEKPQPVSIDNDKKKNGSIGEARENYKFDREVRKLLAEGKIPNYEKGEIVVRLIERDITEEEALLAAARCDDVETALDLLRQECQLCMNIMKITEVVNLPNCQHDCCRDCAGKHFTITIKDRNISEATCPFCMEPKGLADDDDLAANYFAKLDVLIKPIVDQDVHDLFQRKIRDRTLMKDPNFKWCYKCSSGFIADPRNKKLVCPDCRAMSCAKCLLPWETTHEGLSCEDFAAWKEANDPDNQAKGVEKHLQEHGIQCPSCKFRYALTKGGCMHFTCTQCKFEFCIGCERPFKMGVKCGKGPACAKMGLHAHHPRHCLFYLRDKEPTDLQRLLKNNSIDFKTEVPDEFKGQILVRCRVQVQKETTDGLVDDTCNEIAPRNYAGYCKVHYTEYLCALVFRNNVDPVSLLDLGELKQVFARANHFMPKQRPGEYEFQYKKRLAQLVATEVPIENA